MDADFHVNLKHILVECGILMKTCFFPLYYNHNILEVLFNYLVNLIYFICVECDVLIWIEENMSFASGEIIVTWCCIFINILLLTFEECHEKTWMIGPKVKFSAW